MTSLDQMSSPLQVTIANLRARFVGELETRILQIEAASLRLRRDPGDAAARDFLQRDCHKIAGIAATLGFPRLGEIAATIDRQLCDGVAWAGVHALVETLMDEMEGALD